MAENKEEIYLVLGCFGRRDDDFISCPGIENKILNLANRIDQYNQMMDYFEKCRLFDRPMFEYSSITHFIKNMQDKFDQISIGKKLWSEKHYHLFQKFLADHRLCGAYVKLIIENTAESTKNEAPKEESILISAIKPKINLKLIRK